MMYDGPLYNLVHSSEYSGFLTLRVRKDGPQSPLNVASYAYGIDRLQVLVVGERDTRFYGLTAMFSVMRDCLVPIVGESGWLLLAREPKLTASAFVLAGGDFEVPSEDDTHGPFAGAKPIDAVPDAVAKELAVHLAEANRPARGLLLDVCNERDLVGFLEGAEGEDGFDGIDAESEDAREDPSPNVSEHGDQEDDGVTLHEHEDAKSNGSADNDMSTNVEREVVVSSDRSLRRKLSHLTQRKLSVFTSSSQGTEESPTRSSPLFHSKEGSWRIWQPEPLPDGTFCFGQHGAAQGAGTV
eukprot:gnl/MRDRNA2_/MRDRNA2_99010_c0_seq1.p1 gnl/MRDRNA2_/MRDRNA2_99010_c0~~gnl/MRDRNA2_/MRDRNA2_99010_c0_seq1.p1  ORF type:complete len:298 (+),score=51.49 gnl/MRDRNA2_/MRDRNA2_99010_c0_seq1:132-1025(+)